MNNNSHKEEFFNWCYTNDRQLRDYFNLIDSFNPEYIKKNDFPELDDSCIKNAKQMIVNLKYEECFLPNLDDIYPTEYGTVIMNFETENGLISLEIGNTQFGFFTDFSDPNENCCSSEGTFDFNSVPGSLMPLLYRNENIFDSHIKNISKNLEYIKHNIAILSDVSEHRPDLCSIEVDDWLKNSYITIRDLLDRTNALIKKEENYDFEEQFQSDPAIKNFHKEEDSSLDCTF